MGKVVGDPQRRQRKGQKEGLGGEGRSVIAEEVITCQVHVLAKKVSGKGHRTTGGGGEEERLPLAFRGSSAS